MVECQRCGKCCHYVGQDGKVRKCKYLISLPSGKTLCRVYRNRLNVTIDKVVTEGIERVYRCIMRVDSPFDYEGCPYNTSKPRFEEQTEVKNGNNTLGKDGNHR
jgi:hypothetical protein